MRRDLVYLSHRSTFQDLKLLLSTSRHASYPLVDAPGVCVCVRACESHYSCCHLPPESRILIGSVSRHNLNEMLDEHMKGAYKHAHQIREAQKSEAEERDPSLPTATLTVHVSIPGGGTQSSVLGVTIVPTHTHTSQAPERTPSPGSVDVLKRFSSASECDNRLLHRPAVKCL